MSVVGRFTVPAESFALNHALSAAPGVTLEADRLATHSPQEVFPFFWSAGVDAEAFRRALEDDPTTTAVSVASELDDEVLFRLEWRQDVLDLIHEMIDHHASITEATARDGQWILQLRFADESMVTEFQEYFQRTGHQFEVHSLTRPSGPRQREYGLTEAQYAALVAAVRGGYFEVPRGTTVEELSESLGVSANAVSQRLRRGSDAVFRAALTIGDEP